MFSTVFLNNPIPKLTTLIIFYTFILGYLIPFDILFWFCFFLTFGSFIIFAAFWAALLLDKYSITIRRAESEADSLV